MCQYIPVISESQKKNFEQLRHIATSQTSICEPHLTGAVNLSLFFNDNSSASQFIYENWPICSSLPSSILLFHSPQPPDAHLIPLCLIPYSFFHTFVPLIQLCPYFHPNMIYSFFSLCRHIFYTPLQATNEV